VPSGSKGVPRTLQRPRTNVKPRCTRIATWNVNSIKARRQVVARWLESETPDLLLLQETKCSDEEFPRSDFEKLGCRIETVGQKSYNGVAILSRAPFTVQLRRLPDGSEDNEARYIEAVVELPTQGKRRRRWLRVVSLYLPNGNPAGSESFLNKIDWMTRLVDHARRLLKETEALILGGDFNVAPTDADVYDPSLFGNDALCRPETRARFRELLELGFTDVIAARHNGPGNFTFWDYQDRAWPKNHGWRIDHLLLSHRALSLLEDCGIDRKLRGAEKPSDHVPVWCDLRL
jgi:exodeoxyribonuclease-3